MKNKLKIGLTICLSIATILLLALTLYRWSWDYDENGNYFDENAITTYNDDAVLAYGTLTVIFLIPTLILLTSFRKAPQP